MNRAPLDFRPDHVLFRAWDFGFGCTACVFFQVARVGESARWRVRILYELVRRNVMIEPFGELVLAETARLFPGATPEDFGDPAGVQHNDKSAETSIGILATKGITVRHRKTLVNEGLEIVQWLISQGMIEGDPDAAPTILRALQGGYARDDYGIPLKDGTYDHPADAFRYGCVNLFHLAAHDQGGKCLEIDRPHHVTGRDAPPTEPDDDTALPRARH